MSIRYRIIIIAIIFYGCAKNDNERVLYKNLSIKEKDSIAENYHKISNYFLQPSSLYRVYKDSALLVTPDNVSFRQKLSYSYKKRGEHIKAMEILNEAVVYGIEQNNTDALGYRAWSLLYYYRDYEGAILDIDKIEEMTGATYNICWGEPCGFQKGQALYKLKKYDEAISAFQQVCKDEKEKGFTPEDNMYLFFYMGRCYEEKKEFNKAIQNYQVAIKAHDKFPEVYYRLGKIRMKLSDYKGAMTFFNKAKEYIDYKIQEPYIERFDELFMHMIEKDVEIIRLGL